MKVAITGVSGFVGSHLIKVFNDYISIHRNDTHEQILEKLQGVDVVINLAGAPIIKRWSEEYKKVLHVSRIETTRTLVDAINKSDVKHFISTSAVGVYKNNTPSDESTVSLGDDFLASLVKDWETEAKRCIKKTTILRFGIILGSDGGALKQMLPPFKLGVGGNIGDGSMMMSWIDVDDLVRIYEHVIQNSIEGTFNATSPYPVSNSVFTKALGKVLHRPTIFPLPIFVLKLIYGEASTVLTDSKEVYPKLLQESGFEFKYPTIKEALEHISMTEE